jgi:hypothetical protein
MNAILKHAHAPAHADHRLETTVELFGVEYRVLVDGEYTPAEPAVYDWAGTGRRDVGPGNEASFEPYRITVRRMVADAVAWKPDGTPTRWQHRMVGAWFEVPLDMVPASQLDAWAEEFLSSRERGGELSCMRACTHARMEVRS